MNELSSIEKNLNILLPQSYKNTLDKFKLFMEIEFKDYKIDYESIKQVGEKIFARLIVNNDEKLNIDTVISEKNTNVEEVSHSEKLDELLNK